MKPAVGDKVFILYKDQISETTVLSVGRKYFKIKNKYGREEQVAFDTFKGGRWRIQDSFYDIVYISEQAYLDEVEYNKLFSNLREVINFRSRVLPLSLDQLRRITAILEEQDL